MNTAYIKPADKVEITVKTLNGDNMIFTTIVEKVVDDNHVCVKAPIHCGKFVKFNLDSQYKILFVTERGVVNHTAIPVEYLKAEGFNYVVFRVEVEGRRKQRREHFRFICDLKLKLTKIDKNNTAREELDGVTRDISAGGMRFDSNGELALASKVKIKMMLNNELFMSNGKILYKRFTPDSEYKYEYRLVFIAVSTSEKDKIMQYIFNEQRNALKVKK